MTTMALWFFAFCFTALPRWVFSDIQLVESGPGLVRPGSQLNLVCKVTGFSIATSSSYAWHWIRQPPGKGLEWLSAINVNTGGKWYGNSVKGRATISADQSRNEFSLQLNSVLAADSSVYFCVRDSPASISHFDYWGKGTNVIVTSESPRAPSLFPLIPSEASTENADITIGCLAKNFLPDTIDFSWNNPENQTISKDNVLDFPPIMSSGAYTAASQAKVSRSTWNTYEPFYCKAKHPQGDKVVPVAKKYVIPQSDPEMIIRAPVLDAFKSSYLNSTVTCAVSKLCSGNVVISWLKEQKEISTGITTSKPMLDRGGYTIWSKLVVTRDDWISEKKFTCVVKSKEFTRSETFSILSFCKSGECLPVTVETIPPTFADIYQTSSAKLTCKISNIPLEADYSKLNVTWTRASDQKQLHTVMTNFLEQGNDFFYVNAVATVCATEWKEDETFTCKVTFEDVLVKPVEKTLKKKSDGQPKPPTVYILSPSLEQLNLRETVTISCLIQDFNPGSFFVRWLHNEEPISESEYFTSQAIAESKVLSKQYFAYSLLSVSEQEWSAGGSFTCMVGHEALPYNTTQKTVNKNTGKPSIVNVSLVLSEASSPCY